MSLCIEINLLITFICTRYKHICWLAEQLRSMIQRAAVFCVFGVHSRHSLSICRAWRCVSFDLDSAIQCASMVHSYIFSIWTIVAVYQWTNRKTATSLGASWQINNAALSCESSLFRSLSLFLSISLSHTRLLYISLRVRSHNAIHFNSIWWCY